MNNTDKVYLIKWVGPFSYDELYNWEKKWLENNNENFNLYLLQGKRKYASHNRVGEIFSPLSHHRTCRSAYGGST